jgi:two-component sensor histidine kinase
VIALTRRRARDLPTFAAAIDMRVRSLARVHNLMASTNWQGMDLGKMINLCGMTQPDGQYSGRVVIEGPSVYLGSGQILPLASSLVEMFNNSVKYGALSVPTGIVSIRWDVAKSPAGSLVTMRWSETGGPVITGPIKPSLGTELIEGFVTHDLNGKCNLAYPPEGVNHVFEFLALDAGKIEVE